MRVLVGIPLGGAGCPAETFASFCRVVQGWPVLSPVGRTDLNRNLLCQTAMQGDYDALVMLDVDEIHPDDVVGRLVARIEERSDRLVVGGLAYRRNEPYDPLAFVIGPDGKRHNIRNWAPGVMEVANLGTGAIIIRREAMERVTPPWFRYRYQDGEHAYPSEDMDFSERCREAGIRLWLDTTIESAHLGKAFVTGATYRAYNAARRKER